MQNRWIRIQILKNKRFLAEKCIVAESFFARLRGLIGTQEFAAGSGMLFPKCNNVHMWFMSIPIDIVFLKRVSDGRWKVAQVHSRVNPWRAFPLFAFSADDALELPSGSCESFELQAGDELCIA